MKKQEIKKLIGLCDHLVWLIEQPDSKRISQEIIKTCDVIIEDNEKRKAPPIPPKQQDIWYEGDVIHVR